MKLILGVQLSILFFSTLILAPLTIHPMAANALSSDIHLRASGFVRRILDPTGYGSGATLMQCFEALANSFSEIAEVKQIGSTFGRPDVGPLPLKAIRIGTATRTMMIVAHEHGNEPLNSYILYYYAKWLLTSSDVDAVNIRNNVQTWLVPSVNFDSFNTLHRKNYDFRVVDNVTSTGTDLNRNYPDGFDNLITDPEEPGENRIDPVNEWYRGPCPFSEPESIAIGGLIDQVKPDVYFFLHTGEDRTTAYSQDGIPGTSEYNAYAEQVVVPLYKNVSAAMGLTEVIYLVDGKNYGSSAFLAPNHFDQHNQKGRSGDYATRYAKVSWQMEPTAKYGSQIPFNDISGFFFPKVVLPLTVTLAQIVQQ